MQNNRIFGDMCRKCRITDTTRRWPVIGLTAGYPGISTVLKIFDLFAVKFGVFTVHKTKRYNDDGLQIPFGNW